MTMFLVLVFLVVVTTFVFTRMTQKEQSAITAFKKPEPVVVKVEVPVVKVEGAPAKKSRKPRAKKSTPKKSK